MPAIAFASQILSMLPTFIQAGMSVVEFSTWGAEKVKAMADEGRDPTPEEWDELNARTAELRRRLHSDSE